MPQIIDQDRLIRFAQAEARSQRRARAGYRTDAEIEKTIRGWLTCNALFYGAQIVTQEEIDNAIRAYRRVRRLSPIPDYSQRSLLMLAEHLSNTAS